ncbi:hypothetical protein BT96DRAFT_916933 [Gymnopus androsaceus JB14]|uniref:Uncharacterized protein n=1 Tax=Gymnopus androsaceus JB14 TaxID=1447944 RepID=A0A6A4I4L1_9AGAR|nr:hypothetical protein BT96DRAFT_916933 [Gymnopus androsaceus JB14]
MLLGLGRARTFPYCLLAVVTSACGRTELGGVNDGTGIRTCPRCANEFRNFTTIGNLRFVR